MTDSPALHNTRKRLRAQAAQLYGWAQYRPWAVVALLLGAGVLCGTAVRNVIARVQVEILQTAALERASADFSVQALNEGLTRLPQAAQHAAAYAWQTVAQQPIAGTKRVLAQPLRMLPLLQNGVETNPRRAFGHNLALSRHGPAQG